MTNTPTRGDLRLLAIESTCDETAAAVINGRREVLSSVIASQNDLHSAFHGVVPEIAARAHLESIVPVVDEALERADTNLNQLDAIAVATQPGLAGSLMVGLMAAKALCVVLDKPLIEVNHIHAHLYACQIGREKSVFPCVGLVVSGGHTSLYRCESPRRFELLGSTIDDAAGEAFDKVAAMMGLGFPGGAALAKLAEQGDPTSYDFPRSFPDQHGKLSFSFSGLKTAVRYALAKAGRVDLAPPVRSKVGKAPMPLPKGQDIPLSVLANIAASFQAAVVDVLCDRSRRALAHAKLRRLCVGGGVAANRTFREALPNRIDRNCELIFAPLEYCTDNAAMGAIAVEHYLAGEFASLEIDCHAGLVRPSKK
jgi:N6-L-threonylcarbamoyladenine synthase